MDYQSKTTLVTIHVSKWTKKTDASISSRFSAAHAVAVQIASRCQMDIMSLAYLPPSLGDDDCLLTVIYVNNGCSPVDIYRIMEPEANNHPQSYWMIQDFEVWQGTLDCMVTMRGTWEAWE